MDVRQLFCKNIVLIREKYLLSEREMARSLGISVRQMKKIEKGVLPDRMTVRIIFRASRSFGVPPRELFLNREEK